MDIGTRRLRLRPVAPADATLLAALDSDPEVMYFVSGGEPTPASTITDWIIPRSQSQFANHGTGMWVAFDIRTRAFVGWVWLRLPRHSTAPELELSYRFAKRAWRRGLATEAARALMDFAFRTTATDRIFAGTHSDNVRSQRVMQKLGMRLAADSLRGRTDSADYAVEYADVEYEMIRREWERIRARGRNHPPGHAATGVPA